MTDFDGPIADELEMLAGRLRKAGRVLIDTNAELGRENKDLEAENARLREALGLLRPAHHTPYVDEDHQGGNCVDVLMHALSRAHRAENAATSAVSLLETLAEAHASIVMDDAGDSAAQDQLVESARRGVAAAKAILAAVKP